MVGSHMPESSILNYNTSVADRYPESEVIGVDLSPVAPVWYVIKMALLVPVAEARGSLLWPRR
jgi:hypothetical protein